MFSNSGRFRVAARIRPRRSLTGPPVSPELPELAAAVESGDVGDDHIPFDIIRQFFSQVFKNFPQFLEYLLLKCFFRFTTGANIRIFFQFYLRQFYTEPQPLIFVISAVVAMTFPPSYY